ncbi:relaxase/mobilization nuclease domain-containing protein [Bacteroidales bacterium OttesenSCG-928-K03]|nr:relaxase/mobilization nuclease domain-containing protein [Bacteroidales bacterium OttesenSCG-928-L14]MDL2240184.1 relaxase/mobilization nuclease domain-containing protein [Bacteroidales bacterium OttesenSCG-928-K22]MDL2242461.1 relaxase/mobilization nuclease domain-containing protein [Bacteroidales bacterium OttesenSCG-928-K03]
MVAKINVGSSLFGALSYNQNKIDEENGKVLFSNRMLNNTEFNIRQCMESFETFLPQDIKTEKPVIHISLNPHPDDKLSDNQLSDIAREYMDKLDYGNQPYVVYKHEDINRHHLHIVSVRVDEFGKKLNDKFEHLRSKDITRELERKYGLLPAEKQKRRESYELKKVDYCVGDVKRQISNTVRAAMQTYKFQSFNEFKTLMSLYNIHVEELKGKVNDKLYQGIIYSSTNDFGEKQGNPIKSSRLGKLSGYESIERKIAQSSKNWKESSDKNSIKQKIAEVLQPNVSIEEFEKQLKDKNIDVILRENSPGRIYGVTFIDHESKNVFNGSRLGKEFSANVFNDLFRKTDDERHQKPMPQPPKEELPIFESKERFLDNSDSIIGSLFGFMPNANDVYAREYDDVNQPRKKRRKRKRIN